MCVAKCWKILGPRALQKVSNFGEDGDGDLRMAAIYGPADIGSVSGKLGKMELQ